MHVKHLSLLCCPDCRESLTIATAREREGEHLIEGDLECSGCQRLFPVKGRVPVFVGEEDYVDSFGWQWARFAEIQRDSYNGTDLVRTTILKRSGWTKEYLADKLLLECGCGAGSDTEVLAQLCRTVISFDLSQSVYHMDPKLLASDHVLVMRADLTRIPVKDAAFDVVYCHRVIQHTPSPPDSFKSMAKHVKPGGEFFLHSYSRHWKSLLNYKYIWRPLTMRLPHGFVYRTLRFFGPVLYAVSTAMHRIAFMRRINRVVIPFETYSRALTKAGSTLTYSERYEYAFLVTFDALTPTYDQPASPETVKGWFDAQGFTDTEIRFKNPVIALGRRALAPADSVPAPAKSGADQGALQPKA